MPTATPASAKPLHAILSSAKALRESAQRAAVRYPVGDAVASPSKSKLVALA